MENLRWVTHSENNQNKSIASNNTSGTENVFYEKSRDRWVYCKQIDEKNHRKCFKTLESAIEYKKIYEVELATTAPPDWAVPTEDTVSAA